MLAHQAHPYTGGLLTAVQSLRQMVRPLGTIVVLFRTPLRSGGMPFRPRCPRGGAECQEQRPQIRVGGDDVWCFHPSGSEHADAAAIGETIPEQGS